MSASLVYHSDSINSNVKICRYSAWLAMLCPSSLIILTLVLTWKFSTQYKYLPAKHLKWQQKKSTPNTFNLSLSWHSFYNFSTLTHNEFKITLSQEHGQNSAQELHSQTKVIFFVLLLCEIVIRKFFTVKTFSFLRTQCTHVSLVPSHAMVLSSCWPSTVGHRQSSDRGQCQYPP